MAKGGMMAGDDARWGWLLAMLCVLLGSEQLAEGQSGPVKLIFDTDVGNDVDDVLALGMIHSLQSRKDCELLAVTITKDNDLAAPFVDAVNTFYGRGDVPVGVVRQGMTPDTGKFLGMAAQKNSDGSLRYPHDLMSGLDAPEAVSLLRKTLAGQPDRSVVIAQVGFSTNLARLLDSRGDEHSPQDGSALVKQKVRLLSVMAGAFAPIGGKRHREYNVVEDIANAKTLAERWPGPIVYSGFEVGLGVPYPAVSIEQDYDYVTHHPLAESYRLYSPPPHNRPTWDLTSVLYAVYPERGYFELSEPGQVIVEPDGGTRFEPRSNGSHRFLKINDHQRVRVTEALVQLSSQPPGP